jgi:predicted DNA-binding transcriptional regulator YafY
MDTGELLEAVRAHRAVELRYRARDGVRSRIVHPHAVFRTSNGKLVMEGVQVAGDTRSGSLPGWREFELMRVADIRVLDATFTPSPDYEKSAPKYRHGLLASA